MKAVPVVAIMGARQTGKSTFARTHPLFGDRRYVTLDDFDMLEQAQNSPEEMLARASRLTIDEAQREPDLVMAIKRAVDNDRPRRPGRFLLTGSANLLMMERVSETLAGRAAYVSLWPLTRREQLGLGRAGMWSELLDTPFEDWRSVLEEQNVDAEDWREMARRGGYPTPAHELESAPERAEWFRAYTRTYLERDLQDLSAIENLVDFRRLMRIAALRLGGLINQADIGRDAGLSRPTAHRYLNLLETSFQAVRLQPYSVNRTKRLVKSPKMYWSDTGLALHLAGLDEPGGAHLENLILNDLNVWRDSRAPEAEVLYWRTHSGEEVDFVIEAGRRLLPVEVKTSLRVGPSDARHLRTFREQYPEAVDGGLLLHTGDEVFPLTEGVLAAPWWCVV